MNDKIKEFYDTQDTVNYGYEFVRWFSTARRWRDYYWTSNALRTYIQKFHFDSCFELGPGPGTWTKFIFRHNPAASYHLLDISKKMKNEFHAELRNDHYVSYTVDDFQNVQVGSVYDLFFSSRALEYMNDKPSVIHKIHDLLSVNGTAVVITKNRELGWRRHQKKWQHQGIATLSEIVSLFKASGFSSLQVYPVLLRIPIVSRLTSWLPPFLYKKIQSIDLANGRNNVVLHIVESVIIIAKK
jgi:ubiquinone/menaquinone biosynthesis C-methylase UbiE